MYRAQPLAAVLVIVLAIGGFEKFEESITSTASLSTSTMDNVSPKDRLSVALLIICLYSVGCAMLWPEHWCLMGMSKIY